jgi:photosystem II stability/assembly factor-like uncharacterized protein
MKKRGMIITPALLMLAFTLCLAADDPKKPVLPVNAWVPDYVASNAIKDIQMIDDKNAWAVGNEGLLLRQINSVWGKITITGLAEYNLNAIEMKGQYGWIVGEKINEPNKYNGVLTRTTDGGTSWNIISLKSLNLPIGTAFKDVSFANDVRYGYIACGNGIILKTNDAGASWTKTAKTPITEPSDVSGWFNSIYTDPVNSARIRVVGDTGKVAIK